jgi:hypothetical protein
LRRAITDFALLQSQSSYSQGSTSRRRKPILQPAEKRTDYSGFGDKYRLGNQGDIMPIPDSNFTTKRLESLAVAQRLDLRPLTGT